MHIYVLGLLLSLLFTVIAVKLFGHSQYYSDKHGVRAVPLSKVFAFLSFLPLTCIAAIRHYAVGTDTAMYCRLFIAQDERVFSSKQEYLFAFLMDGVYAISSDRQVFIAVTSIILYGLYYFAIYKNSEDPVYSVLLFFLAVEYLQSLNIMRQYLATAILLFSLPALEKRKWKVVIPIVIFAFFIHRSSLVWVIIVALSLFHPKPFVLLIGLLVTGLSTSLIKGFVLPILQRYNLYSNYFSIASRWSNSDFSWMFVVYCAFFVTLYYLYYLQKVEFDEKVWILFYAVTFAMFFSILTIVFPENSSRLATYANSLIVIYTPSMLRVVNSKTLRSFIKWTIVIGYVVICIYGIMVLGWGGVLPYRAFWQ